MNKGAKIYVSGHRGLVGNAVAEKLKAQGYKNLLVRTHDELDLLDPQAVKDFFKKEKPDYVIHCAAKVGGIQANVDYPAEFLYENLQIQNNVIWTAKESGVKKFMFVSSAVIYPNECPQPMKEEFVMHGPFDETKSGYAHAKIAGVKLCEAINEEFGKNFISVVPTNIYGVKDNFNPETAHVIPALIRRMHEAKVAKKPEVVVWGTGKGRREFLYVDDLADAIVWLTEHYDKKQFLNIGTGEDITMKELAETIKELVGYEGKLVFDATKPEGMKRRLFDTTRLTDTGWQPKVSFKEGLGRTYDWYLENIVES